MSVELITILMFIILVGALISGIPISFALGGIALVFIFSARGFSPLQMVATTTYGWMNNYYIQCIPLFTFMALMLERSGVVDQLYQMMYLWTGSLRGGLAIGSVLISTIFAAMVGLGGMAVLTLGLVALPEMLRRGYDKSLAMGSIMGGSALGILIPPSLPMVLYGTMAEVSIGKLLIGGILPGLVTSGIFIIYIGIRCFFKPELGPAVSVEEATWRERLRSLKAVLFPMLLIIAVLGSIWLGVATATEAASIGALGSIVAAAINRKLTWENVKIACTGTLKLSCMIMWLIFGAALFASVYTGLGAREFVSKIIIELPLGRWGIFILMQLILLFLGCFMDPGGIIMITVPIFVPIIRTLGFDPIWYGIIFTMNMEMAFLTPPFGFNLFF